jgi:hypothetical protein
LSIYFIDAEKYEGIFRVLRYHRMYCQPQQTSQQQLFGLMSFSWRTCRSGELINNQPGHSF